MIDNIISINGYQGGKAGIDFIAPFKDQKIYTISFLCKGNTPLALKLFRVRDGKKTIELEDGVKYIDNFPATKMNGRFLKEAFWFLILNMIVCLCLSVPSPEKNVSLQIKDLKS